MSFSLFLRRYFVYLLPSVFIAYIVLESYQIDLRPYYVAGKSILLGLDPYFNPVTQHPELYTPVNAETRASSGFIYPPLAALFCVPLALFPYAQAKLIYSGLLLVILWLLIFSVIRHLGNDGSIDRRLEQDPGSGMGSNIGAEIVLALCSFPVYASFERGQVDIIVCYLALLSFWAQQRRKSLLAGYLLAIAAHIKVFPLVLLLYYGWQRQFKLIIATIVAVIGLGCLPVLTFGHSIYVNFAKNVFPKWFGYIQSPLPMSTHGQTVVDRLVKAIEGKNLLVTHDFVHGYMNPFLRNNIIGGLIVGTIALGLLLYFLRKRSQPEQFFSAINTIHLYNPSTWIMGLVWYLPFYLYQFRRANAGGKLWLSLPLFLPPSLNTSGMLAYVVVLSFAIPGSQRALQNSAQHPAQHPAIASSRGSAENAIDNDQHQDAKQTNG